MDPWMDMKRRRGRMAGTPERNGPVMDKLVFLFHRKDGLTRQEFFEHYLDVHAPLGTARHRHHGRLHREPGRHRG